MSILSAPFSSSARRTQAAGKPADAALLADRLAELEARDQALAACIESIIEGRLDVARPTTRDRLSDAVGKLLERLASSASRDLDRVVNLSIQGSETAISTASLLGTSREVDHRTQSLAAASEELVASIGQIRATAQAATGDAAEMRASAERGMSTADSASAAMGRVGTTANLASEKITALNEASEAIGTIVKKPVAADQPGNRGYPGPYRPAARRYSHHCCRNVRLHKGGGGKPRRRGFARWRDGRRQQARIQRHHRHG
jgi:methyl-accepting chemotaxis protein